MFTRRDFARLTALASVAALAGPVPAPAVEPKSSSGVIKPPRLKEGDTVGIVLPASLSFEAEDINLSKERLEALGFKVKFGAHVFDRYGSFAGTDRDRASDVNAMFADPEVDGIFCFTGGWGTPRILPFLDYQLIRRNPKVLIGYSDITALINTVHQRTGLVTFHGPVADSTLEPYTLENLKKAVMSDAPIGVLSNPPRKDTELVNRQWHTFAVRSGKGSGRIVGGNLTLMSALMGTPYEVDTAGGLLFLEDIHEEPYRIDRMLTQLQEGGKFDRVKGVVWGRCTQCVPKSVPSFSEEEVIRDHFGSLGVPVLSGFAFGHIEKKITLPLGLTGTLDADAGTVTIDESAVA